MRAHEWTRARQRSVRQISGALREVAEEEETHEAGAPEPGLLTDEGETEPEPGPAQEAERPAEEEAPADEAVEFPEAEKQVAEPVEEVLDQTGLATEPATAEEEPEYTAETAEAPFQQPGSLFEAEQAQPPPAPSRPSRAATRRSSAPEQAQLPLGLEPIVEKPPRRSATETREELIQRLLDPHLTLQETAKLLNVCPTTVRRYTNRGLLAHYRTPGNQRRFRLSDVLAFMERQGIPAHGLERKRSGLMEGAQQTEEDVS